MYGSNPSRTVGTLALLALLVGGAAAADELDGDVTVDSEITVVEQGGYGSYRERTVEISIREGVASLLVETDGEGERVAIPLQECVELWDDLREGGIADLENAQPAELHPDASGFLFIGRVGSAEHRFTVVDPDRVEDPRYRDLLSRILRVADQRNRAED